jgi:membrane fusion protein, multidrug efflux system
MLTRSKLILLGSAAAVVASLGLAGGAQEKAPPASPRITSCVVSLIDESHVPAREAGVLIEIVAREGQQVEAGALLAQINDDQVKMKKKVAEAELEVAKVKAADDINVRYATAAYRVNYAGYDKNLKSKAKSEQEMAELWLKAEESRLGIDKAKLDQKVAAQTEVARKVEVDSAQNDIERRQIKAPIAGEVVKVIPRLGEWVNPGAPVVHIARLDRLYVEGYLKVADFSPEEIKGRPVTVKVTLERNRVEEFKGKIVNASPLVEGGIEYQVQAAVDNRRDGGDGPWLLRPGLQPEMTIDVSSPLTARERPVGRNAAKPER